MAADHVADLLRQPPAVEQRLPDRAVQRVEELEQGGLGEPVADRVAPPERGDAPEDDDLADVVEEPAEERLLGTEPLRAGGEPPRRERGHDRMVPEPAQDLLVRGLAAVERAARRDRQDHLLDRIGAEAGDRLAQVRDLLEAREGDGVGVAQDRRGERRLALDHGGDLAGVPLARDDVLNLDRDLGQHGQLDAPGADLRFDLLGERDVRDGSLTGGTGAPAPRAGRPAGKTTHTSRAAVRAGGRAAILERSRAPRPAWSGRVAS